MPKIKRYWPCSHGFNRDPEIQELRRTYADWMGYVWQEMCAIGDLNDGEVKGTPEEIGLSLAYVSMTKRPSLSAKCITNALHFMEKRGWIVMETHRVLIVNHAKYHTYQIDKKVPPNDPNKRSEQTKKNKKIAESLKKETPPTPWPSEDVWLSELLKKQTFAEHCGDQLQDYQWWELCAASFGGIDKPFIEREFAKIGAWWRENPTKRKTANGMKRFIRTWLEKSKNEQGRQLYAVKR